MANFFEHNKFSFERNYLRNLIFLATADGQLDEVEKLLVYRIAHKRGLKGTQIKELIEERNTEVADMPESLSDQMNLLFDLMQMLYVDGHVNKEEVDVLRSVLARLNLDLSIADDLIKLFEHHTPTPQEWSLFVGAIGQKVSS